jgi:hypothetical protein
MGFAKNFSPPLERKFLVMCERICEALKMVNSTWQHVKARPKRSGLIVYTASWVSFCITDWH